MNPYGHVYFIECAQANAIKIGWTTDPSSRVSGLQVGCPLELRLLATMRGDGSTESELHRRFADLHIRGEWFRADQRLVEFVRGLADIGPAAKESEPVPAPTVSAESEPAAQGLVGFCLRHHADPAIVLARVRAGDSRREIFFYIETQRERWLREHGATA